MRAAGPESGEARRQFEEEVFPAELDYVEDRRRSVGDDRPPLRRPGEPRTDNDLVGLALSGGGIRSASFSLGFLQSLGSRLFHRIDYLSTVSGGGFIGSSISALMAGEFYRGERLRKSPDAVEFPFPLTPDEREPEALSHLRNNSNYMAPSGPGDLFRLLAVLLRGILLNSLALAPFLLLVCLVVLLVYGEQLSDRARFDDQVRQIDGLLERLYGDRLATKPELEPLLEVLEAEAVLRVAERKTRGDVIQQLRPPVAFQHVSPAAGPRRPGGDTSRPQRPVRSLITGNGTPASPYRLRPGADREELARALLEGDVLQRYEVIEEIELLARLLEQAGYRHCWEADDNCDNTENVDSSYVEELSEALSGLALIRPGTDEELLESLVDDKWSPTLKPILQALYNGEYLSQAALGELVRDELDRRSAYYAYGWYEARVGESFEDSWHGEEGHAWPGPGALQQRIDSELRRLAAAFGPGCLEGDGKKLPGCLRPGSTPPEVRRLLAFEEVLGPAAPATPPEPPPVDATADRPAPGAPWTPLAGELGGLDEGGIAEAVKVLYFGEYLNEDWVRSALRPTEESADGEGRATEPERLADVLYHADWELPIDEMLVLRPKTVCADLTELLLHHKLIERPACFTARSLNDGLPAEMLAAVWDLLEPRWVHRQLYAYHYGWHRGRLGNAYQGNWCEAAPGRLGTVGCPEVSDESWLRLSRALRDPSRWDAGRLRLPFTWVAIRVALGWVLLMPLVLLAARAVYRRRRSAVAGESNPLRALLSSDRSIDWRDLYERTFGGLLMVLLGVALIELLPYAVHHFHYLRLGGESSRTLAIGALSLLLTALGGPALALLERFGRTVALVLLALAGPLLLLTLFVCTMEYAVYPPPPEVDSTLGLLADRLLWLQQDGRRLLDWPMAWALFGILSAASLALAVLIDINATSLHGLYRDRLAKAFMVGLDTAGDVEPEEDLPLEQICPAGSGAPYHLLNVALNLQGSGDRSLRGRDCDALCFSRDHVGGPRTGFCRTRDLAGVSPQADLASAMAVSAAAVSPNMGRYKSGTLAILLSLLNTRLALWIPHPGAIRAWFGGSRPSPAESGGGGESTARPAGRRLLDAWRRFRLRAPATLLLRELFGALDDRGPVVNVSDGGHLENTGALELLRRRCREIVIVDGEADPEMAFGGLAELQRIARIDMGIELEIDLGELRPDESGLSRRRTAIGRIRYPERRGGAAAGGLDAEIGRLLYVKLAVTGEEGETVTEYRARNRAFPHQSTGDQAFDEGQFEAYRRLGELAGRELFGAAPGGAR